MVACSAAYGAVAHDVADVGNWDSCTFVVFTAHRGTRQPAYVDQHAAWAAAEMVPMLHDWSVIAMATGLFYGPHSTRLLCTVLPHLDKIRGNLRCNNALDIAFDLNDRNGQASGKTARQRDKFKPFPTPRASACLVGGEGALGLTAGGRFFCFWIE